MDQNERLAKIRKFVDIVLQDNDTLTGMEQFDLATLFSDLEEDILLRNTFPIEWMNSFDVTQNA